MGKFTLRKEEFNVKEIFDEIIELQRLNADVKGIKIALILNIKKETIY